MLYWSFYVIMKRIMGFIFSNMVCTKFYIFLNYVSKNFVLLRYHFKIYCILLLKVFCLYFFNIYFVFRLCLFNFLLLVLFFFYRYKFLLILISKLNHLKNFIVLLQWKNLWTVLLHLFGNLKKEFVSFF